MTKLTRRKSTTFGVYKSRDACHTRHNPHVAENPESTRVSLPLRFAMSTDTFDVEETIEAPSSATSVPPLFMVLPLRTLRTSELFCFLNFSLDWTLFHVVPAHAFSCFTSSESMAFLNTCWNPECSLKRSSSSRSSFAFVWGVQGCDHLDPQKHTSRGASSSCKVQPLENHELSLKPDSSRSIRTCKHTGRRVSICLINRIV